MIKTLKGFPSDLLPANFVGEDIVLPQWTVLDATFNSTLAGAYADNSDDEQGDAESRDWAELAFESFARWAKENPY